MKQIVIGYDVVKVNLDTGAKRVVFSGGKDECLNYCKKHPLSIFVSYRYFVVPRLESRLESVQLDLFNEIF